jgi:hypothetical protein
MGMGGGVCEAKATRDFLIPSGIFRYELSSDSIIAAPSSEFSFRYIAQATWKPYSNSQSRWPFA